jgi:hypothetical protein
MFTELAKVSVVAVGVAASTVVTFAIPLAYLINKLISVSRNLIKAK